MYLRPNSINQLIEERGELFKNLLIVSLATSVGIGLYIWYRFDSLLIGAGSAIVLSILFFILIALFSPSNTKKGIEKLETEKLFIALDEGDEEAFANSLVTLNKTIYDLDESYKSKAKDITLQILKNAVKPKITDANVLELSFLLCVGWNQYKYDLNANKEFYDSNIFEFLRQYIEEKLSNYACGSECVVCSSKEMSDSTYYNVFTQTSQDFEHSGWDTTTVKTGYKRLSTKLPICRKCNENRNSWWLYGRQSHLFMIYVFSREDVLKLRFNSDGSRKEIISTVHSSKLKTDMPYMILVPDDHLGVFLESVSILGALEKMEKHQMVCTFMNDYVDVNLYGPTPLPSYKLYGFNMITYPSFVSLLDKLGIGLRKEITNN